MAPHWSLWLALRVAALATVVSMAAGLWPAFAMAKRNAAAANATPAVLKALLSSPVILYWIGSTVKLWPLTELGLLLAGIVCAAPVFLNSARGAFGGLDPAFGNAARSLGASEWRAFSRVELPLAWRPALAGAAYAFTAVLVELLLVWWLLERAPR